MRGKSSTYESRMMAARLVFTSNRLGYSKDKRKILK